MDDKNFYPHFSQAEFARRYAVVRAAMQEADLPALLVYGMPSMSSEVQYLSNYATTREAFLIFPAEPELEPALFAQMYNHIPTARRITHFTGVHWGGPDTAEAAVEHVRQRGFAGGRIGLLGRIPMGHYGTLKQGLPEATFVDFTAWMLKIRLVKSDEELDALRIGAEFCDRAVEALEREARPGISEHELAAIVQCSYLGSGGRSHIHYMATTPMSNPSICVPAQYQSKRILEKGDVLLTELSSHYFEGYTCRLSTLSG